MNPLNAYASTLDPPDSALILNVPFADGLMLVHLAIYPVKVLSPVQKVIQSSPDDTPSPVLPVLVYSLASIIVYLVNLSV